MATSRHERFANIALGFCVGLGAGLIYVALTVSEFRSSIQAATGLDINGTDTLAQWIMAITSMTSTVGVVLVWLTFQETRKGNLDAKLASDTALAHAQRVSDQEYRPYVFFTEPSDKPNGGDFDIRNVKIAFKNFGRGVAKDVGVGTETMFFPKALGARRKYPSIVTPAYNPKVRVLPPGERVTNTYENLFSPQDIDRIKFSEDALMHSRLNYLFGENVEHDEVYYLFECIDQENITCRWLAASEIMYKHETDAFFASLPRIDDQGS